MGSRPAWIIDHIWVGQVIAGTRTLSFFWRSNFGDFTIERIPNKSADEPLLTKIEFFELINYPNNYKRY